MKTPSEVQKERIAAIEAEAIKLLDSCNVVTLTSVNEKGYPRTCCLNKIRNVGFSDVFFFTSKRSHLHGKATHFETNSKASVCYFQGSDSATLVGDIEIVSDKALIASMDKDCDRNFFKNGTKDPKCRLLRFHTHEATFWIGRKFRTCRYK